MTGNETTPDADRGRSQSKRWTFPLAGAIAWATLLTCCILQPKPSPPPLEPDTPFPAQPATLQLVGTYPMQGQIRDMAWVRPHLYLGLNFNGLTLLRCDRGRPPKLVRHWPGETLTNPLALAVRGDLMYVADRQRGLLVLDIAQPTKPRRVFEEKVEGIATGLALDGDRLALALGGAGALLYDISIPHRPRRVSHYFQFVDYVKEAAIDGPFVYLADNREGGLKVLRILDSGLLKLERQLDTGEYCDGVRRAGDRLLLLNRLLGICVYTLKNPALPREISRIAWPRDTPTDLQVQGDWLLAVFYRNGLSLISLADPTQPQLTARANPDSQSVALCIDGDRIFLGDKKQGILIYHILPKPQTKPPPAFQP